MAQEFGESMKSGQDKKQTLWIVIVVLLLVICCLCLIGSWVLVWLWNNGDYLLDQLGLISRNVRVFL